MATEPRKRRSRPEHRRDIYTAGVGRRVGRSRGIPIAGIDAEPCPLIRKINGNAMGVAGCDGTQRDPGVAAIVNGAVADRDYCRRGRDKAARKSNRSCSDPNAGARLEIEQRAGPVDLEVKLSTRLVRCTAA